MPTEEISNGQSKSHMKIFKWLLGDFWESPRSVLWEQSKEYFLEYYLKYQIVDVIFDVILRKKVVTDEGRLGKKQGDEIFTVALYKNTTIFVLV